MFGFKSKKDKRIEELERLLAITSVKQPRVITQEREVVTLQAKIILEPGMPIEYAKEHLAHLMVQEVKQHMTFDLDDDNREHILLGQLRVVI